jgi:hypothetical protein
MKPGSIRIQPRTIAKLLKSVDEGRFAIPRLQREFVWNGPKAAKLLDSIYRGMPIGTLLIWEVAKNLRLHLRQRYHVLPAFNHRNSSVWFLIDGQQRVSVLHHVRQGDTLRNAQRQEIDFSRVVLSLQSENDGQQIRYRRPVDGQYLSLSVVLHPHWRQKLHGLGPRAIERVSRCRERILRYTTFQMFIEGGLPEIREAFLRINTQGMKITTADAVFTQAENLELRDVVHELRQQLDDKFADIGNEPLLFLLSAVRGGTEARGRAIETTIARLNRAAKGDARLQRSLAKDWNRLGPSVAKAANYLRERFSVVSRAFLASDYILSMLAYFFFFNQRGPNRAQAEQIRRWFWATSVGSRYSGRDFNRLVPQDLKFFKALAQNPREVFRYTPQLEMIDVRRAQYGSRGALTSAVLCMLLNRRPVYLLDDGLNEIPIQVYAGRADRKDRHHIFPRQPLANAGVPASQYNSIANICLLVAQENQQLGSRRPSTYLEELRVPGTSFGRKMARHLIPADPESGLWDGDLKRGFRRFVDQRAALICQELEKAAGIRLFRRDKSSASSISRANPKRAAGRA